MVIESHTYGPGRGGLGFRVKQQEALPFFTAFLPFGTAPPLMFFQYPAHSSRLSSNTLSHETILDSSLFLLSS